MSNIGFCHFENELLAKNIIDNFFIDHLYSENLVQCYNYNSDTDFKDEVPVNNYSLKYICNSVYRHVYNVVAKYAPSNPDCAITDNIYCNQNGKNLIDETISIDSENFFKMCVVDYLISNSDRHSQNWGFYVNNYNGNIICLHPLYDHNNAFNKGDMKASDGGPSIIYSGQSKKDVAKYSIKRCSLKCISEVTDNLFLNEVMRESFFDRASILGLYHKQNKIYIPNNIFSDDSKVYYDKIDENIKSAKDKIDGIGSI